MIFKCFECDEKVKAENKIGEQIIKYEHCGKDYKTKQYKNGNVTVVAIDLKQKREEAR